MTETKSPFQATTPVSAEMVMYQICAAVEGGCTGWAEGLYLESSEIKPTESPWYSDTKLYESKFRIRVKLHEPHEKNNKVTYYLTPKAVQSGLDFLAKNHPSRIAEIVGDNADAETADVFLQACLFNEIVYG